MSTFQQTQTTSKIGIAEKDQNTFSKLYEKFAPFFFGMMVRSTRDRFLSEVLLQQIFKRTWQFHQNDIIAEQRLFARMNRLARLLARENAFLKKMDPTSEIVKDGGLKEIDKFDKSDTNPLLQLICLKGFTWQEASRQSGFSENDFKTRLRLECNRMRVTINE